MNDGILDNVCHVRTKRFYHGTRAELRPGDLIEPAVGEALKSSDPLVRAFALIDRRVGVRTLGKLEISGAEHALVKAFYDLRLGAARA